MTKGQIVDLILLSVLGGKLSDDANVQRAEISAYLPLAMAQAIKVVMVDSLSLAARTNPRVPGTAFNQIYTPYVSTPEWDNVRGLHKVAIEGGVINALDDGGVAMAYPEKNPSAPYMRLPNAIFMAGMEAMALFPSFHAENGTVYFHNLQQPVGPVVIMRIKGIDDLGDDEDIPLNDDVIGAAITIAESWFRRQASGISDSISDNKDKNEK